MSRSESRMQNASQSYTAALDLVDRLTTVVADGVSAEAIKDALKSMVFVDLIGSALADAFTDGYLAASDDNAGEDL